MSVQGVKPSKQKIEARALRRLRYATARHDLLKIRAQI